MTSECKQTSIGLIPSDWRVGRLGDERIVELVMGQSPSSSTYNKKGIGLPFLQGKAEFGDIFPSPSIHCSEPIRVARKNDILLSVRAPVGDVNIAHSKCCIGRGLSAIRAKENELHHRFLFYYLKFSCRRFEALSMGSTFKAIRKGEIERYKIPIPLYEEQEKIAEILSSVDDAIQKNLEAIAKTELLKKGLMRKLLAEGVGHKEFKETKIGKIPKTWKIERLEDICEQITDGSHWSPKDVEKSDYRIATVANMKENYINVDSCKFVSRKDYARLVKEEDTPNKGDILFSKDGTVGISFAFKQDEYNIGVLSSIAIIRPNPQLLDSNFGAYVLKSPYVFPQVIGRKTGTALKRIILKHIRTLRIPLPVSLDEQRKIAAILSTVDSKLELDREHKGKLACIKTGLMNDLFSGRRRVKVGM